MKKLASLAFRAGVSVSSTLLTIRVTCLTLVIVIEERVSAFRTEVCVILTLQTVLELAGGTFTLTVFHKSIITSCAAKSFRSGYSSNWWRPITNFTVREGGRAGDTLSRIGESVEVEASITGLTNIRSILTIDTIGICTW